MGVAMSLYCVLCRCVEAGAGWRDGWLLFLDCHVPHRCGQVQGAGECTIITECTPYAIS